MQKFRDEVVKCASGADAHDFPKDVSYFWKAADSTMDQQALYLLVLMQLRVPYLWRMFIDAAAVFPAIAAYCSPIRHRQFLISKDLCEYQQIHYLSEYFPEKYVGTVILPVEDTATQVDLGERGDIQTVDSANNVSGTNLAYLTNSDGPRPDGAVSLIDMSNPEQRKRVQSGFAFDKCTQEEYDLHREYISGWRKVNFWKEKHENDIRLESGRPLSAAEPPVGDEIPDENILDQSNTLPYLAPHNYTLPTEAYRTRKHGPWSFFDTYNFAIRKCALYYGVLAMFDLMLLPFMFPLYVTEYRWVPIQRSLDSHGGSLLPNDILQIMKQTFFLCLDAAVMIPTLPFLWITKYRYEPIEAKLQTNFVDEVRLTCQLYGLVYKQFIMFLLDIAFLLPTLPLIYLYNWRAKPVKQYIEQRVFAKEVLPALDLYSEAIKQVFFMALDGLILIPTVPVLIVTRLRWIHVKASMQAAFAEPEISSNTWGMYIMAIGSTLLLCIDTLMSPFIAVLFITRIRYAKIMNIMYKEDLSASVGTTFHFYWSVVQSMIVLATDIMFIPLFAVVFATQIHWPGVHHRIKCDMHNNYMTEGITDYTLSVQTYFVTCWLFVCVLVDIAMILPVLILMITHIRWFPVKCDLMDLDIKDPENGWRCGGVSTFRLWGSILSSCLQLSFDIILLPMSLVVLVTWYRSWNMRQIWAHPYCFYIGAVWHTNVFLNFITIVLYDVPSVLLGLCLACIPLWTGSVLRMLHFVIFREYKKCDLTLAFQYNEFLVRKEYERLAASEAEKTALDGLKLRLSHDPTAPVPTTPVKRLKDDDASNDEKENIRMSDVYQNPADASGENPLSDQTSECDQVPTATNATAAGSSADSEGSVQEPVSPMVTDTLNLLDNDKAEIYKATAFPSKLDYRTWLNISVRCGTSKQMVFSAPLSFGYALYSCESVIDNTFAIFFALTFLFVICVLPTVPIFALLTCTWWRASKIWSPLMQSYRAYSAEVKGEKYQLQYKIMKSDVNASAIVQSPADLLKTYSFTDERDDENGLMNRVYEDIAFLNTSDYWDDRKVVAAQIDEYVDVVIMPIVAKTWGQFFYLVKDCIALFPFGVIAISLYRLLPFVIDAIAKSGAKPLTDVKPLFTVMSMKWTFKDKGNPSIELELLPTEQAESLEAAAAADAAAAATLEIVEGGGTVVANTNEINPILIEESPIPLRVQKSGLDTDFFQLNVPLQVYCRNLFDLVGKVFGATIKSVAQAFLPLTLHGDVYGGDIEMREFQAKVQNYKGEGTLPFVMHLPARKPKKSSVAKKLHSLKDVLLDGLASGQGNLKFGDNKTNDLAFVMQVECTRTIKSTQLKEKVVLFRICPSIYELTAACDSENGVYESTWQNKTGPLSLARYYAASKDDLSSSDKPIQAFDQDNDFVDNFAFMSWMAFCEILIDVYHLFLTGFLLIAPWRFAELAYSLLFTKLQHVPFNTATRVMACLEYGEQHLNDYVKELLPIINATAKMVQDPNNTFGSRKFSEFGFAGWSSSEFLTAQSFNPLRSPLQNKLEKWSLYRYQALRKRFKLLTASNTEWLSGIEFYEEERHKLHKQFVHLLGIKTSVLHHSARIFHDLSRNAQIEIEENISGGPKTERALKMEKYIPLVSATINAHLEENKVLLAKNRRNILICYQNISDHCHKDTKVKGMPPKLSEAISGPINAQFKLPEDKKSKKMCLFHQPTEVTRALIRRQAKQVLKDISILFFSFFLVIFIFSAFPLIRDLMKIGSVDIRRYKVKAVIEKNIINFVDDLKSIVRCIFWITICALTVFSFLPFLNEVPEHMESFDSISALAKEYSRNACVSFFHTFLYLVTGRTYYLIFSSSLYAGLVPAACIGDVVYQSTDERTEYMDAAGNQKSSNEGHGRLYALVAGALFWASLAVGAFLSTTTARKAGAGSVTLQESVNSSMLMVGMLFLFLFLSICFVWKRKSYALPAETSKTAPNFSYHMFLALLTPLFETAQLVGVIVYFFWSTSTYDMALTNDAVGQSGAWASRLYSWGNFGGGPLGFKINMNIAVFVGLVWVGMITLPVMVQGEEQKPFCGLDGGPIYDQKELNPLQRATRIRTASAYKFLSICITRLFTVWLMASLLRPISCMAIPIVDSITGATTYSNVLSTLPGVQCGGGTSWTSVLACAILVHLIVTTTSVGADDADLLTEHQTGSESEGTVKFSPLYALQMRACQFFTLAACMGGFTATNRNLPLGAALVACIVMALLPFAHKGCCSFKALVPFRSCGALGCAWAIAICMYRHTSKAPTDYNSGVLLFVGWGVLLALGCLLYRRVRVQEEKEWRAYLGAQGFDIALTNLQEVAESLLVQESGSYSQIASRAEEIEITQQILSGHGGSRSTILARERHQNIKHMISTCNTVPKLAIAVAEIEDKCQYERLSPRFLLERMSFHYNLLFHTNLHYLYTAATDQQSGQQKENSASIAKRTQLSKMSLNRVIFAIDYLRNHINKGISEEVDIKISISEMLLKKNVPAHISSAIYGYLDVENADGIRELDAFISSDLQRDIGFDSKQFRFTNPDCMRYIGVAAGFYTGRLDNSNQLNYTKVMRALYGHFYNTEISAEGGIADYYDDAYLVQSQIHHLTDNEKRCKMERNAAAKLSLKVNKQIEGAVDAFLPIYAENITFPGDGESNTVVAKSNFWKCELCSIKSSAARPRGSYYYKSGYKLLCLPCTESTDKKYDEKQKHEQSLTYNERMEQRNKTTAAGNHRDDWKHCSNFPGCLNVAPKFRDTCGECNRFLTAIPSWVHPNKTAKPIAGPGPAISDDDFYDENGNRVSVGGSILPPPASPTTAAGPQVALSDDDFYNENGNRVSVGGSIYSAPAQR